MAKIVTTICPKCDSKIQHLEGENPRRCVSCKAQFVNADDVVVLEGESPATIVKVDSLKLKGGVN